MMAHDELREAVARAICRAFFYCDLDKPDGMQHWNRNKDRCFKEADAALAVIRAAFEVPTPEMIRAGAKAEGEARKVIMDVTAHLVAAVSLLKRGGKKAAPSDKMFNQMINDYMASIARGRAALTPAQEAPKDGE